MPLRKAQEAAECNGDDAHCDAEDSCPLLLSALPRDRDTREF